jgi:hypothetical protein
MAVRAAGHDPPVLRDATGRFAHRPVDVERLRHAADEGAALRRAEHDAAAPDGEAAELVRRVEGLLRWSAG